MLQRARIIIHHKDPDAGRAFLRLAQTRGGSFNGNFRHRQRKDELGAMPQAIALRVYATAVGFNQPLADGQAQTVAIGTARFAGARGVAIEDVRESLRRKPLALVRNRHLDMHPFVLRGHLNGGGLRGVSGRIRQQVAEHLHDALPVGHHPRQVRRQVNLHGLPAAAANEGVASLVYQAGHSGRLGSHRQRAGLHAPRVQQIADQVAHVIGLLINDAEELHHLGRVDWLVGAQHRGRRTLDRGQRRAQLMAHHAKELGPHSVQFPKPLKILHGDDHGYDLPRLAADWGGVDQHGHAAAIGHRKNNLLGAHCLRGAELLRQRDLVQGNLVPVREPAGDDLQLLLD